MNQILGYGRRLAVGNSGYSLFSAYNPTTDWRFSEWRSVDMKALYGSYVGELPRKADEHLAYYVEVGHTGKGGLGYVSSLVEILRHDQ